ncbi:hypothetical protein WDU94_001220 [Cyamophila willieti]
MSKENGSKFNSFDKEFDFYLKFTKPFVLNKSSSDDRARSVVWIKKLMNEEDKKLRLDYLKLLLYALQKPTMIGMFRNLPPPSLEPLPEGLNIMELIDKVLEEPEKENVKDKVHPTVSSAVSHDLTEYAAVQNIPNFGVQCFYATSPISINQWHLSNDYLFPRKYIYGAEAWEQSLSHLYHTDLAGHLVKNVKTEQKVTIDCCKDKPKPCKKSDISGSDDTIIAPACDKREDRGPKSPPWSTPAQACELSNHQNNRTNVFRWDEQSRLDSSYDIQPNCTLHEDFILNNHGLAQFETDQIALLLAHKNVQKNVDKEKCLNKKDKSLNCSKYKTIYNAAIFENNNEQSKHIPVCIKRDFHPSKLNLRNREDEEEDDDDDDDDPEAICKGKDSNKPLHPSLGRKDTKESTTDSFDNCPWEDSPDNYPQRTRDDAKTYRKDDNTKNFPKTKQELTRMFEQEIPVPKFNDRIERFNHYKNLKNKERIDERQENVHTSSTEHSNNQILSLEQPFKQPEQPGRKNK